MSRICWDLSWENVTWMPELGDLERHCGLTVDPGEPVCILEGAVCHGDILERDHLVAVGLDGQVQYVLHVLEQPRHLDREASVPGVHGARRDELVVAGNELEQRLRGLVEAFEAHRIDDHLHEILAIPRDVDLENAGEALQLVP
jgi:hypothetical protein